jgi:EAL domain-containing protein (putative c-di-GMP-specific phosphodiesterase class I)
VHLHSEDSEEASKRHNEMNIVTEITSAFEENRFTLFCQKIIPGPAARNQTPHIELLIRMVKRDGELILPKSFIPAAERFYLMQRIDTWVVQQTLEFMETNSHLLQDEVFSINLSGQSLANDSFLDFLVAEIARGRTHPGRLCFEVTETAAISNLKKASHFIKRIKELGCYFSLDDFGSGLSSFAYLKNLNVDYLKIDGAFVKDMLSNETDAAMVEAINQIGHVMGLKTIAEYVENHAILDAINHLGVDYAQGYGIHRPEPLTDLIRGNARNMTASPKNATSSR